MSAQRKTIFVLLAAMLSTGSLAVTPPTRDDTSLKAPLHLPEAGKAERLPMGIGIEQLRHESRIPLEVEWGDGRVTFVRGVLGGEKLQAVQFVGSKALRTAHADKLTTLEITAAASALAFAARYRAAVGLSDPDEELRLAGVEVDELGMSHVTLEQVQDGIEVFQSVLKIHVAPGGVDVVAASSSITPNLAPTVLRPKVGLVEAIATVRRAQPGASLGDASGDVRMVVYARPQEASRLAWVVEVHDADMPDHSQYLIDALTGAVIDVFPLSAAALRREIHNANYTSSLPGALARSEGGPATGVPDVNNVYAHLASTYNYFLLTHAWDGWDNRGATCAATVNYRKDPAATYPNAYWDGRSRFVFGEGLATKDITAHEFGHAVTQSTANLIYVRQSGALNESMSDIFGAMVDRDDWFIGEGSSVGVLRDMANPASTALGTRAQPAHANQYVVTCEDCGGVHKNSGIPNKAFHSIAMAIGNEKAERVYFRALRHYLTPRSHFKDVRASVAQAATDLYGCANGEVTAIRNAFSAVGVTAGWEPPASACGVPLGCLCAATVTTNDRSLFGTLDGLRLATTLYRVRDRMLVGPVGTYYRELFYEHTAEIGLLLLNSPELRQQFAILLMELAPLLNSWTDGRGGTTRIPAAIVQRTEVFLEDLAREDRARGTGRIARVIANETRSLPLAQFAGQTMSAAWDRIAGSERADAR